jgi:glutamate synthase domain-containing protein 2
LIASGKIVDGFDMLQKIALGADLCNVARPMMFAVGCIQALRCHTGNCPTGVTTQDPKRAKAMFDGCSHYNEVAQAPKQMPRMLQQALQHAWKSKVRNVAMHH